MKQAMKASGAKTKKAAVEKALQLLIRFNSRRACGLCGKVLDGKAISKKSRSKDKWAEAERRTRPLAADTEEGCVTIIETSSGSTRSNAVDTPETQWLNRNLLDNRIALTDLILCEVLQGMRSRRPYSDGHATSCLRSTVIQHGR